MKSLRQSQVEHGKAGRDDRQLDGGRSVRFDSTDELVRRHPRESSMPFPTSVALRPAAEVEKLFDFKRDAVGGRKVDVDVLEAVDRRFSSTHAAKFQIDPIAETTQLPELGTRH